MSKVCCSTKRALSPALMLLLQAITDVFKGVVRTQTCADLNPRSPRSFRTGAPPDNHSGYLVTYSPQSPFGSLVPLDPLNEPMSVGRKEDGDTNTTGYSNPQDLH